MVMYSCSMVVWLSVHIESAHYPPTSCPPPISPTPTPTQDVARITDSCKDHVERLRTSLQKVNAKLAPWEEKTTALQSRLDVAVAERTVLVKKHDDAKSQLKAAEEALAAANATAVEEAGAVERMEKEIAQHRCVGGGWWGRGV